MTSFLKSPKWTKSEYYLYNIYYREGVYFFHFGKIYISYIKKLFKRNLAGHNVNYVEVITSKYKKSYTELNIITYKILKKELNIIFGMGVLKC